MKMKKFATWLKENNLNEISADLLGRAAHMARQRDDYRGNRLERKFNLGALERYKKMWEADNNKIRIVIPGYISNGLFFSPIEQKVGRTDFPIGVNMISFTPERVDEYGQIEQDMISGRLVIYEKELDSLQKAHQDSGSNSVGPLFKLSFVYKVFSGDGTLISDKGRIDNVPNIERRAAVRLSQITGLRVTDFPLT